MPVEICGLSKPLPAAVMWYGGMEALDVLDFGSSPK